MTKKRPHGAHARGRQVSEKQLARIMVLNRHACTPEAAINTRLSGGGTSPFGTGQQCRFTWRKPCLTFPDLYHGGKRGYLVGIDPKM